MCIAVGSSAATCSVPKSIVRRPIARMHNTRRPGLWPGSGSARSSAELLEAEAALLAAAAECVGSPEAVDSVVRELTRRAKECREKAGNRPPAGPLSSDEDEDPDEDKKSHARTERGGAAPSMPPRDDARVAHGAASAVSARFRLSQVCA